METFEKLRSARPEHLRPAVTFLYFSGRQIGAAQKIIGLLISPDNSEITMPRANHQEPQPHVFRLVGRPAEIADTLAPMRKSFPGETDRVFDFRTFRKSGTRPAESWDWASTLRKPAPTRV